MGSDLLRRVTLVVVLCAGSYLLVADRAASQPTFEPSIFFSVYRVIGDNESTIGGRRNNGGPNSISLLPAANDAMSAVDLARDPVNLCQPIGPFRMTARENNKLEMLPLEGKIIMIYEDLSHGLMRAIHMDRDHLTDANPTWLGDSVGRWEDGVLVIETIGFNTNTWLNDMGAQHSEQLRLVERIQPVEGGTYLEYSVMAEDPMVLESLYTYTRYYERIDGEMSEDVCAYAWPD